MRSMAPPTLCCDRCFGNVEYPPCSFSREGGYSELQPFKMETLVGTDMTSVYLVGNTTIEPGGDQETLYLSYIFSWITKKP